MLHNALVTKTRGSYNSQDDEENMYAKKGNINGFH